MSYKPLNRQQSFKFVWLAVPSLVLGLLFSTYYISNDSITQDVGIEKAVFLDGLAQCRARNYDPVAPKHRTSNPRYKLGGEQPTPPVLIKNATLWNGDGHLSRNIDILFQEGIILKVGNNLVDNFNGEIIEAHGHYVTPGIVDLHSHAGLDSWPEFAGASDTNEMSESSTRPYLRSLDGFSPYDTAIGIINSGGVTTSLVLPGSGTAMGGEAFAFKHRLFPSNRSEDMLLNAGMEDENDGPKWRWMKMACGENPINNGRRKNQLPESRLGLGYLFRKRFDDAQQSLIAQDQWCYEAQTLYKANSKKAHTKIKTRFPVPIDDETMIALLRGKVRLNAHCYESYDLEAMIRLSHEYNFKITAFHHALEAWRVAPLLAKEGIATAIFADHWGYKKEAYDSSVKAAQVLSNAGVQVVFKSDHPVLNAQNLIYEAAKAHHYGLDADLALKAVTSAPAQRMGQDWRIGYVLPGYDADIVIWDKYPLAIGAHPLRVFTDGYTTFKHVDYAESIKKDYDSAEFRKESAHKKLDIPTAKGGAVTYHNIAGLVHGPTAVWEKNSVVVVENGIVTCIGSKCAVKGEKADLNNGWVIPGLVAASVRLGIEEISSEPGTSAGKISTDDLLPAADGIFVGRKVSKALDAAFKAGVTSAISIFKSSTMIKGISTLFRVGSERISDSTFIKRNVADHFQVDVSPPSNSISSSLAGQITTISKNVGKSKTGVVAVDVDGAAQIYALLHNLPVNVIIGGAEAHVLADELAKKNVSVVLSPTRCTPSSWYKQECLVTGSSPTGYSQLYDAGVNVAISGPEDNFIRGLIWEAGWIVADLPNYHELSDFEKAKHAASLLTWNVAKAFKLEGLVGTIAVGSPARFVVYDDIPGTLEAKVTLVIDQEIVENETNQY
ncbi:hypothetical protein HDV06_005290 [Boothiomyces sp. JEL0866]|nr:hypothetical protein HDV06_005290 [Boothiomyces sp. JEL0866]